MVLAVLRGEVARQNLRYLGGRKKWPLAELTVRLKTEVEASFASLKREGERKERPK